MTFDTTSHERLVGLGRELDSLRQEREALLDATRDVWSPLGRRAPFLRAAFDGVDLPVKSNYELIERMGGEDRVIVAPSLDGGETAVTVRDFVDAIEPFLDEVLPVSEWDVLAHEIVKREHRARRGRRGGARILANLGQEHLRTVLASPERTRAAFPHARIGEYAARFADKRSRFEPLLEPIDRGEARSVQRLYSHVIAHPVYDPLDPDLVALIAILIGQQQAEEAKDTVPAKTGSAVTHLNNAEQCALEASALLDNVLDANNLTTTVTSWNTQAENKLDSATQLLAQAIADLAAAEAAAQKVPNDAEAASAVAEAQAKLEQVQNQLSALTTKMGRAEAHKDVLAIDEVCITIRCIEDDPCCDDNWNGVNVCIRNTGNPDVEEKCGTTSGNGSVTICGRFADSPIVVTTNDGGDWNETRSYDVGSSSASCTIKTDLPGWE